MVSHELYSPCTAVGFVSQSAVRWFLLELYSPCTAVGFVIQSAVRWFLLNCTALVQLLGLLSSQQYGGFS